MRLLATTRGKDGGGGWWWWYEEEKTTRRAVVDLASIAATNILTLFPLVELPLHTVGHENSPEVFRCTLLEIRAYVKFSRSSRVLRDKCRSVRHFLHGRGFPTFNTFNTYSPNFRAKPGLCMCPCYISLRGPTIWYVVRLSPSPMNKYLSTFIPWTTGPHPPCRDQSSPDRWKPAAAALP